MVINLFGNYQLRVSVRVIINKIATRKGVCSRCVDNEKHVLLWDFDNIDTELITNELLRIQDKYKLPDIYIVESSMSHYHAYSFTAREFQEIIHILSDTKYIDILYLRLGMVRGYYTLRYSEKNNYKLTCKAVLKSGRINEISPYKITLNEYSTTNV